MDREEENNLDFLWSSRKKEERQGSRPAKTGRKRPGVSPKREETRRIDGIPSPSSSRNRHVQLVIENVQLLRASCTINSIVFQFFSFFFFSRVGTFSRNFFFFFLKRSKNFGKKERKKESRTRNKIAIFWIPLKYGNRLSHRMM